MARAKSFFFQGEIREKTFTGKILKETHDHRDAKYKVFHNFNQIKGREILWNIVYCSWQQRMNLKNARLTDRIVNNVRYLTQKTYIIN